MSLIIKGMKMPTPEQGVRTINIYADGVITNYADEIIGHAVPLPEKYGRLFDADAPIRAIRYTGKQAPYGAIYETTPYQLLCKHHIMLDSLKTIVPAEGGGEE